MTHLKIKLIACLGNPGDEYENTYHNAGYLAFNYLCDSLPIKSRKTPFGGFDYAKSPSLNITLVRPNAFMNNSGKAVKDALRYFGFTPAKLLIIHDDSDIELGKYKFVFGRGAAGHHGVESVALSIKTKSFWRLRVGIREPNNKTRAGEFVLTKISLANKKKLEDVFKKIPELLLANHPT